MTTPDDNAILDAFDRRLAAIERLVPEHPPTFGSSDETLPSKVIGPRAVERGQRIESNRRYQVVLAPIGFAAVAIVALVGMGLLIRPLFTPGRVASPSATAVEACARPSPLVTPLPVARTCEYVTSAFQPPLALRLEPTWTIVIDSARELSLQSPIGAGSTPEIGTLTIALIDNVATTPCQASGVAGPTRSWAPATPADGPQALMDWIESDSGVPHSPPSAVKIDGHAGLETTLSAGVGSLRTCGGVAFLSDLGSGDGRLQIRENEAMQLAAIEVGGRTVVIGAQVPRAMLLGAFTTKADLAARSLVFP